MDETTEPRHSAATLRLREHHHRVPELAQHWITLPPSVCRAARSEPQLRALFPSHVGFFLDAGGHRVRRRAIDSTIVKYCVKGRGWCELAGRTIPVEPGDIMVVPSGTPHAYGSDLTNPWSVYWFHAMGEALPDLLDELCVGRERPVARLGQHPELVALFLELKQTLEDDYCKPQLRYAARILTYLFGMMIRLRHEAQQHEQGDSLAKVRRTIEHLGLYMANPTAVDALAAVAGLSPSHYSALFRTLTGYSPKNYLIRLRMHRAAELLDTTSESVSSIARRVGYEDPLHFSRAFRRSHDVPPSQYRKAHQPRPASFLDAPGLPSLIGSEGVAAPEVGAKSRGSSVNRKSW